MPHQRAVIIIAFNKNIEQNEHDEISKYLEIRDRAFNCLAALLQHILMCSVKVNLSSSVTPIYTQRYTLFVDWTIWRHNELKFGGVSLHTIDLKPSYSVITIPFQTWEYIFNIKRSVWHISDHRHVHLNRKLEAFAESMRQAVESFRQIHKITPIMWLLSSKTFQSSTILTRTYWQL